MILPENRHPLFRIMHGEAQGLRSPVGAAVQDRTLRTVPESLTLSLGDQLSPWREPQWNAAMKVALADPGVQERAKQLGMEMRWSTPDEMTARMKSDIARWGAVIAKAHIPKR